MNWHILKKFKKKCWHFSFILYNFVFKKPYFFNFFNLSNMENIADFLTLLPY